MTVIKEDTTEDKSKKDELKTSESIFVPKIDAKKGSKYLNTHRVLIRPLMTEKVNELMKIGKYVFEVAVNTNKIEISKAFEDVYKIRPININTLKMKGKVVGRGKIVGKRKNWKKVIVKLPKGKTIQIHEKV